MQSATIFVVFLFFQIWNVSDSKTVSIFNGPITGEEYENFYAYRGIPYAQAPIGELRLAPPLPYLDTWNETREFRDFGSICATYTHIGYDFDGNEDCLFLNVYVPKAADESPEKLPVLFSIHGGCFSKLRNFPI